MRSIYDTISDYREELKVYLQDNTVKDPALFWAGKMSILVHSIYLLPLANIGNIMELLHRVSEEYDDIIFKRVK